MKKPKNSNCRVETNFLTVRQRADGEFVYSPSERILLEQVLRTLSVLFGQGPARAAARRIFNFLPHPGPLRPRRGRSKASVGKKA